MYVAVERVWWITKLSSRLKIQFGKSVELICNVTYIKDAPAAMHTAEKEKRPVSNKHPVFVGTEKKREKIHMVLRKAIKDGLRVCQIRQQLAVRCWGKWLLFLFPFQLSSINKCNDRLLKRAQYETLYEHCHIYTYFPTTWKKKHKKHLFPLEPSSVMCFNLAIVGIVGWS